MKRNLLLLALLLSCFSTVFSQKLYINDSVVGYFNPGLGSSLTPISVFDEVLIPSELVQGSDSVRITQVKFAVLRDSGAPAVTVTFFYSVVDTSATTFADVLKIPVDTLGSINLPANGPSTRIRLGDSVNTLFSIKTDTGALYSGYQAFFLGASFSDGDTKNGLALTKPRADGSSSDNDDVMWVYDVDDTVPRYLANFGGDPPATFYLEVYGGKSAGPLPVTLADFGARRAGNINILNWNTQDELNASHFIIERSNDGRNYSSIGQVNASGNTGTVHHYTFTDEHPGRGFNYYRLRIVDKDNQFKLSRIRSIRNEGIADVNIYPNPVTQKLSVVINADKATDGFITITDLNGKAVYSRKVQLPQGNSMVPVMVNNFAAGSYIMKIQLNDDVVVKKFNKQ